MAIVVVMRGGLGDIVLAQRALSELKSNLTPGGELLDPHSKRHLGHGHRRQLVVANVIGMSEAELAEVVAAPALHRSVHH